MKSDFTADDSNISSASTFKTTLQDSVTLQSLSGGVGVYAFLLGSCMFLKFSSYHSLFSSTDITLYELLTLLCVCVSRKYFSHRNVVVL